MRIMQGWNRFLRSKRAAGPSRSRGERMRSGLRGGEKGQALVETALVAPILMIVLLGIFVFGTVMLNYLVLAQGVGAGAQNLQQIRQSTSDPCKDTYNAITQAAPTLTPGSITLTLSLNGTPESGNTCGGAQTLLNANQPETVTAKYPCTLVVYAVNYAPSGCQLTYSVTEFEF